MVESRLRYFESETRYRTKFINIIQKKKKKLENREKVDSFFRNDNSVGENDTSV